MSEPTTLGEYVERCGEGSVLLRRIVYGTDEPCSCASCIRRAANALGVHCRGSCPTCHGTGRDKTPGLVERWMLFLCYAAGVVGEDARSPDEFRPVLIGDVLEFLRREIGDNP